MIKAVVLVVVLAILGGGGFFLYKNFQTTSKPSPESSPITATTPTPSPSTTQASQDACQVLEQGSTDVPPLYKEGITWQQPTMTEYEVPLKTEELKLQGCFIKSNEISVKKKIDIRGYYSDRLLKSGWNNIVSADGPTGGLESYQKQDRYFVVSVNYQIDADTPQSFTTEVFYRE